MTGIPIIRSGEQPDPAWEAWIEQFDDRRYYNRPRHRAGALRNISAEALHGIGDLTRYVHHDTNQGYASLEWARAILDNWSFDGDLYCFGDTLEAAAEAFSVRLPLGRITVEDCDDIELISNVGRLFRICPRALIPDRRYYNARQARQLGSILTAAAEHLESHGQRGPIVEELARQRQEKS